MSAILLWPPNKLQVYKRCEQGACECILALVKTPWFKAGFQAMSDKNILKNLMKMDKKYSDLSRSRKQGNS